jgi:hypothetical protein
VAADQRRIAIHARELSRVRLTLGRYRPRVQVLNYIEEGGEVETSPPRPATPTQPATPTPTGPLESPEPQEPRARPPRRVVGVAAVTDLTAADLPARIERLTRGIAVDVQVATGEILNLEDIGPVIDAADRGEHELRIQLMQHGL